MGVHYSLFDLDQPFLWTVPDVLSPDECRDLIARAEGLEWLEATVNTAEGRAVRDHIRSNQLAILDDPEIAATLLDRLRPHLPERMSDRPLVNIWSRLRCYRYRPGDHFGLHRDQKYRGPDGLESQLTLMVYLNEGFAGGETAFPELKETVVPRPGLAALFQHMVLHCGNRVDSGVKYALRTDVFYGLKGE